MRGSLKLFIVIFLCTTVPLDLKERAGVFRRDHDEPGLTTKERTSRTPDSTTTAGFATSFDVIFVITHTRGRERSCRTYAAPHCFDRCGIALSLSCPSTSRANSWMYVAAGVERVCRAHAPLELTSEHSVKLDQLPWEREFLIRGRVDEGPSPENSMKQKPALAVKEAGTILLYETHSSIHRHCAHRQLRVRR